ncbi:SCP2 sterol-binding domain-containing protein [Salipaludibacillus sp. HK11]|uniref:SCP2 sterol-binding domain-containing protein n=1 Tax=Salipaludibacillus sp. HK11 TaxID=3394320 RepID=UPI0039FD5D7F
MSVKETFIELITKMNEEPSHLQGVTYVYEFNLFGEADETYQLKVDNNQAEYSEGTEWEPRLKLEMSDENFIKLAHDDLNATMAYMSGKLKVHGELGHALKLQSLIQKYQ